MLTNNSTTDCRSHPALREKVKLFFLVKMEDILFQTIMRTCKVNLYWMNREGYYFGCNEEMLKRESFKEYDQFVGKHPLEIGTEEAWHNSKKVMDTGCAMTFEEKQKDAEIYYHSVKTPIFNDNGEVIGLVGISIDITERKKHEIDLKTTQEQLQLALIEAQENKIAHRKAIELHTEIKRENENLRAANFVKTDIAKRIVNSFLVQGAGLASLSHFFEINEKQDQTKIYYYQRIAELFQHGVKFCQLLHFYIVILLLKISRTLNLRIMLIKKSA